MQHAHTHVCAHVHEPSRDDTAIVVAAAAAQSALGLVVPAFQF